MFEVVVAEINLETLLNIRKDMPLLVKAVRFLLQQIPP